jgi:hypothetical protein
MIVTDSKCQMVCKIDHMRNKKRTAMTPTSIGRVLGTTRQQLGKTNRIPRVHVGLIRNGCPKNSNVGPLIKRGTRTRELVHPDDAPTWTSTA